MGQEQPVDIKPRTRAATLYRTARITEPYYCNYGLNPSYEAHLADAAVTAENGKPLFMRKQPLIVFLFDVGHGFEKLAQQEFMPPLD